MGENGYKNDPTCNLIYGGSYWWEVSAKKQEGEDVWSEWERIGPFDTYDHNWPIPDFLCNAGGVTTSYFEGVQNDMNFYWNREEVLERLDTKMTKAFLDVLEMSKREDVYMRDAAYMVAIEKVVRAMELRGWI